MRNLLVSAAALAWSVCASAQTDVSETLERIRAKHDVPAMAALVVDESGVVLSGVCGVRERGEEALATLDDKWHLGSCTKAMTATLVGILVERGDLSWDLTVGEVFPDVEMVSSEEASWSDVTLEHLLSNQGGVPTDLGRDGLWGELWRHEGTPTEQRRTLLVGVTKHPPKSRPGTDYEYSNGGFAIAGHMAETVTGVAWEELMRRELFGPLGMDGAGFGAPGSADEVDRPRGQPFGHRGDGTPVKPGPGSDNPAAIGPAGTVHAPIGAWANFVLQHALGEEDGTLERALAGAVVSGETMRELHRARGEAPYALGWLVTERGWGKGDDEGDTGRVITHNGSNTMWFAVAWVAPERGFAVLVTCNQGGAGAQKATDEAAGALIGAYRER